MIYLLDTNIIVLNLQKKPLAYQIRDELGLDDAGNDTYLSVVSIGEITSLALQNKWGQARLAAIDTYLSNFVILDINVQAVLDRYAETDAFSQNRLSGGPLGTSARNMGKNDLWIAATTSVIGATLITTDRDFDHLHSHFLNLVWFNPTPTT